MTELPTVDVIILSWDRTVETIEAIESVLEQENVNQRVLLLDQGSKPEGLTLLRAMVSRESRIEFQELARNIGVAAGRNTASNMGVGAYIVALDNDAVLSDKGVLRRVVDAFEADKSLGAIAFRILNYYTNTDDIMCWDYPKTSTLYADQEFEVTRYVGAGHAIRRNIFYEAGSYDEALFFTGEERDLCYRILNLGFSIMYIPSVSVRHKVVPDQRLLWNTGRFYYMVRNILYSDYKYGRSTLYLLKSVAALTLKGFYNRIGLQAFRGAWDAFRLAQEFRRKHADLKLYQLSPGVRDHIRALENVDRVGFFTRLSRLFRPLPGQA